MKERASPDWKPPPPAVIQLKTDNFDEFITNQDIALVEFYAPWYVLIYIYVYSIIIKYLKSHTVIR